MAGFKTLTKNNCIKKIENEIDIYEKLKKNKSRSSPTELKKREDYMDGLKKLFDIAAQDLESLIEKDRLLGMDDDCPLYRAGGGYTRKQEDLEFLTDQRGERKMTMGERDVSYETRKKINFERARRNDERKKMEEIEESQGQSQADSDSSLDENENEVNEDFIYTRRVKKKSDTVVIELPRDILNTPSICAMLDRTGTTSRAAVGVVSTILKSGKIDGNEADLSSFTISRSSLERKRASNRTVLMEQAISEFQDNKPR